MSCQHAQQFSEDRLWVETFYGKMAMVMAGIRGKEFSTLMEFQIVSFPLIKYKLSCRLSYLIILQHHKTFSIIIPPHNLQFLPIDFYYRSLSDKAPGILGKWWTIELSVKMLKFWASVTKVLQRNKMQLIHQYDLLRDKFIFNLNSLRSVTHIITPNSEIAITCNFD